MRKTREDNAQDRVGQTGPGGVSEESGHQGSMDVAEVCETDGSRNGTKKVPCVEQARQL